MRRWLAAVWVLVLAMLLVGVSGAAQTYAPVVVSGAGSPVVNGTYTYAGLVNGRPAYVNGSYSIEWFTNATSYWKLGLSGYVDYYCNLGDTPTPPSTGWQGGCGAVSDGLTPYPTLSGGEELLPEIDVRGNGLTIVNGDATPSLADHTDFGTTGILSGSVTRTFSIHNTGTGSLTVGTVSLSGSGDFAVTVQPGASVAPGASTAFTVRFDPSADGLRTASVEVPNGDSDENPYSFAMQGTGDGTGPSVTNVTPSLAQIADANVGAGTFSVTVDFGEAMNTGVNPGLTFSPGVATTLSLFGTAWIDSDTFRATYSVSDSGTTVASVSVDVTGGQDVYGNAQQDYAPQAEFSIDTQNPTVTNVVAGTSPVYDGDLVQEITVTWSEAMNVGAVPTIAFSSGTWTPGAAGVWSSGNTVWTRAFTLTDANATVANVTVDVTGAQDAAGNAQQDYTPQSEFSIDTQNPTVNIAANDTAIYDGDVGTDRFVVTATFSEAMNPAVAPSLVFLPGMATTFTNPSAAWGSGNTVYTWTYDVVDDGATVPDVDLMVSGAVDVAGNTQISNVRVDYVDVDLENPTVVIVANDTAIYDGDVGADRFVVTATFSEPMNSGVAPTLTFVPSVTSTFASPSGAWSGGNTTYTWTYDVADANTTVADVDVSVSGARDVAGNTQIANTNTDYVDIDTQNPTVTGVSSSDLLVTDADAGGSLVVSVDFSEPMGAAFVPTLVFAPSVVGTLTFSSGAWADADTYQATYSVSDANTDVDSVTVDVIGAKDLAGNDQANYAPQSEFGIDTLNPTVTGVVASDLLIADSDAGLTRYVTADFSEPMDPAAVPVFSFAPDVASTLTLSGGVWQTTARYRASYVAADANVDVNSVTVDVTAARDAAGNAQLDYTPQHEFEIDTLNPTVVGIVLSDLLITDADVGGTFTVTINYSEPMLLSTSPTVTFVPGLATTLTLLGSSGWSDADTYVARYTVLDGGVTVNDDDVQTSLGRDLAGNVQIPGSRDDDLDVDTENPIISGFTVTGGQVETKGANGCVREVTWNATVTDPNGCMDPDDIVITSATVRTSNASITAPYAVTRTAVSPTVAVIAGTVDVYDVTSCPAIPRIVLEATDCVGNSAMQAQQEDEVYDVVVPTINEFTFNTDGTYATPTDEYEVDGCCVTTVYFSANVTDNCCVSSGNIGVTVTLPTVNAVLENVSWQASQDGQKRVEVTGHADVRCLSSCFARVQVVVTAYDCCGNHAATVTSAGDEGLVWDRRPPEPRDDPNGYEAARCDRLEVRRDDFGQFRLMIRESTPTYVDVLCNDSDNCSSCTCCANLWIYDIVDAPEFGTASIVDNVGNCHGGTSIRYAPNRGYLGPDRFTYRILDACGNLSQKVTAYLETIREVDMPDVFASSCAGAAASINVTATDLWINPDKPYDVPFRFSVLYGPSHGVIAFDAHDVRYDQPSTVALGGLLVPTLTFMESATVRLRYTPALGFVGRDALRVAFDDPYGGRTVGLVDVLVGECPDPVAAEAGTQGRYVVIVSPPTFEMLVADLAEAVRFVSLDDGSLYSNAVKSVWSGDMGRHVLVIDTEDVPRGIYEMTLALGDGETARLWIQVGETR